MTTSTLPTLPQLPEPLSGLAEIASNLRWSWDPPAIALFREIDPGHWEHLRHNPVALLQDTSPERLQELARDHGFTERLAGVLGRLRASLRRRDTWASRHAPELTERPVACFSLEIGLHESLRTYSGGLGVLAGDHIRAASDLGVGMVGVSLLYRQGYFRQVIDDHHQVCAYPDADFSRLPLRLLPGPGGAPLQVPVPHGHHVYTARVWELLAGRARVLLLDTDHDQNGFEHRYFTHQLYGGDERTRIAQEVLLGIGGVRALLALGIRPAVLHLNEGHSAFAPLELVRQALAAGTPMEEALAAARRQVVFTTHTPVAAGHDRFGWEVVDEALGGYREEAGWAPGTIMDLGRIHPGDVNEPLCMTVMALKLSRAANGVSELHGRVSREMWRSLYPTALCADQVPIDHVTNGVHPTFWMDPAVQAFYDEHLPGWRGHLDDPQAWEALDRVPAGALWRLRCRLRRALVERVRRLAGPECLDPEVLTVGFARRFAPYKRGTLVFSDPERLRRLVRGERPLQLVLAGKAHPRDLHGQALLSEVLRWTHDRRFRGRVVFLEDYDIALGRALISGVDLWLNNPRRPREASGTSGQKVPLNLGINLSVLDGWWAEGHDGTNGWVIGGERDRASVEEQDSADADSLYRVLEEQVLPAFYERDAEGVPTEWVRRMRRSVQTCVPVYNSWRMMREYVERIYL